MNEQGLLIRKYGLRAVPLVQWLLEREPDVKDKVREFAEGRLGQDFVEVAGPPRRADLEKIRFHGRGAVPLPCVTIRLKMVKHHLTGEPGVEATVDDKGFEELLRWYRLAAEEKARQMGNARAAALTDEDKRRLLM